MYLIFFTLCRYISYFRLNKKAFKYILDICNPNLEEPKRKPSEQNELKLAATKRILTTGIYQKGDGNDFNINLSQLTISKVFHECINVMYDVLCLRYISFVMDEN